MSKRTTVCEVVSGTRVNPGMVLATFSGTYKCGGPATACLRWFDKMQSMPNAQPMFFRKVTR